MWGGVAWVGHSGDRLPMLCDSHRGWLDLSNQDQHQINSRSAFVWELACLRCGHPGASGIPGRSLRRQASSHIWTSTPTTLMHPDPNVGAGLLANAVGHSAFLSLIHRLLKQAHSTLIDASPANLS